MTDTLDAYDDEQEQQPRMAQVPRKEIRRLEKLAKEGSEAKTELEQLKRERAFVQAGVPLDDKRASYFIAGYSGEQSPESIKAAWVDAFGPAQSPGEDPSLEQEVSAMQAAQDLVSTGGVELSESRLAERNAKLAAISPSDPRGSEKFDAIFNEYGGQMGAQMSAPRHS